MPPALPVRLRQVIFSLCLVALIATPPAQSAPGRLIEAVPISDAPARTVAWRIRYETSDKDGGSVESTGVLIAPAGSAQSGDRAIVAWAHGTTGVAEDCAPSRNSNVFASIPALAQMMDKGWIVVATDYPGLGTPGPHPYLVGEAAARAVLDSVRAARDIPGAAAGTRFIAWGLSQGAHAALFTGQVASRYAPELQLTGVVAAAPPTVLAENLGNGTNVTIRTVLTAFAAASWSNVYDVDLKTIATPVGQRVIRRLVRTCTSAATLHTKIEILRVRRQLGHLDLTTVEPWRDLLALNSAGNSPAGTALFVAQGGNDQVVAPDVTRRFAGDACRRGEKITLVELSGVIHGDTARASADQSLQWMADRFAGKPPPDNCPVR